MILNKSSMERGLCHGYLYKTEMVDLKDESKGGRMAFGPEPHDPRSRVRVWEELFGRPRGLGRVLSPGAGEWADSG